MPVAQIRDQVNTLGGTTHLGRQNLEHGLLSLLGCLFGKFLDEIRVCTPYSMDRLTSTLAAISLSIDPRSLTLAERGKNDDALPASIFKT
jgi:hypothetical protein